MALILLVSIILFIQFYQNRLLGNTIQYQENVIAWQFFQLEAESMRLREALLEERGNIHPDKEKLHIRFEIFYSRLNLIVESNGLDLLVKHEENAAVLTNTAAFIRRFSPYFENEEVQLSPALREEMLSELNELRTPLFGLSQAAAQMSASVAEERTTEVKRQMLISTALIVFQCLLALLFLYIVARQMRQLDSHAGALVEALRETDRSYAELSSYMQAIDQHALVTVLNLGERILYVNERFCQASGYTREELLGQPLKMLRSGVHSDSFLESAWDTVRRGEVWRGEICNRAKDGSLFWVDSAFVPVRDVKGNIARYISVRIEITEKKQAEQRIRYLATFDALTGLPNRYLLLDRMQQALAHDRRSQQHAAVLFVDLDSFKAINDTLGHEIGDQLLKEVANRLAQTVRDEDTVARQGGDEFIVLLASIHSAQDAESVAKKILDVLSNAFQIEGRELFITASIGIAVYPDDGQDVKSLLKSSDIAMYHAKTNGRNNHQFFAPYMNALASEKQELTNDLRQAIVYDQFELNFQPVRDFTIDRIIGMETLLRWRHPTRGMVAPQEFISLAEETGMIVAIGEWVLHSACRHIREWQDKGYIVPRLAVNLSPRQFRDKSLPRTIARILNEHGVDASQLGLEITESMLVENAEEVAEILYQLTVMGLEISIDDFGTGYSSLNYLKRFPINKLKIDRSFIKDVTQDADDELIVTAIIGLAHGMHMLVVAEGVETQEQFAFLRKQGCDQYQGYYCGRAMSAAQVENKLLPETGSARSAGCFNTHS